MTACLSGLLLVANVIISMRMIQDGTYSPLWFVLDMILVAANVRMVTAR